MTEPDWKRCDEKSMWQWVASHLERCGISTVLVGGAAAAVHSMGAYQSGDIDLPRMPRFIGGHLYQSLA